MAAANQACIERYASLQTQRRGELSHRLHVKVDFNPRCGQGRNQSHGVKRGDYPVQGTRRKHPVNLRLGFAGDEFGYLIDMGLPSPGNSAFNLDPEIKQEYIWHGPMLRPSSTLVDRHGPIVRIRSENDGGNIVADSL